MADTDSKDYMQMLLNSPMRSGAGSATRAADSLAGVLAERPQGTCARVSIRGRVHSTSPVACLIAVLVARYRFTVHAHWHGRSWCVWASAQVLPVTGPRMVRAAP